MSSLILDLLSRCVASESIKKASPRHGGEWHSPCPKCGGRDRFIVFPEQEGKALVQKHGIRGTWSCPRHCDSGGDAIDFCTQHLGMSFAEACYELGIKLEKQDPKARRQYRPLRKLPTAPKSSWTPTEYALPADKWCEQATKLAEKAHETLLQTPSILTYLAKRGLPMEAVVRYGLGYIEGEGKDGTCIYRQRSAFGLTVRARTNGTVARAIRIPRGITIPFWSDEDPRQALRVRIRRRDVDINKENPKDAKFQLIPQETSPFSAPLLLYPKNISPELATWVVVEAELDAMLVHHACAGRVGVMSMLTVTGKPDVRAYAVLSKAARILVCIDFEQNAQGEFHTAKAWSWWKDTFVQAKLWPVPKGKDPGEAFAHGVDIARWISLADPKLTQETKQPPEANPAPIAPAKNEVQSLRTVGILERDIPAVGGGNNSFVIPPYFKLADIPQDVLKLAEMWRHKPITFEYYLGENGERVGFKWSTDHDWKKNNRKEYDDFLDFVMKSDDVKMWLGDHVDNEINDKNILFVFGKELQEKK